MPLITLTALLFLGLQAGNSKTSDLPPKPVPVAVLCNGDDGLTARLCDQVKKAFGKSSEFTLQVAHRSGFLIVRIQTNVRWKKDGNRTKAIYSVEVAIKDGKNLGTIEGSCWEGDLGVCAAKILTDTRSTLGFSP
jgi:hypothetical protein